MPGASYDPFGDEARLPDTTSEEYMSDQVSDTVHVPRYPGALKSTPLAPHRIARIANSFGVHTPVPHSAPISSFANRRSVSSGSSFSRHHSRSTTATRLLIHIIPPLHLPSSNGPEPPTLNGPRPQVRRGTLLPLHTTLQGQLEAIKREYNFPSIAGLVVYLLDAKDDEAAEEFIGPRISDEAWKLLWSRVFTMEREETQRSFLSPSLISAPPSPMDIEDGTSSDSHGHDTPSIRDRRLLPLRTAQSIRTSPSTTTLSSVNSFASNESSSSFPRRPGIITQQRSASLASGDFSSITSSRQLPPSPVVGKIEFDIDLQKGRWYEQWSQRKWGTPSSIPSGLSRRPSGSSSSVPPTHRVLISAERLAQKNADRLKLPNTLFPSSHSAPITPITPDDLDDESPAGYTPLDDDDAHDEDDTNNRFGGIRRGGGLGLGMLNGDEDDWRDLQSSRGPSAPLKTRSGPAIELSPSLEGEIEEADPIGVNSATKDLEEVLQLWNARSGDDLLSSSPPPQLSSPIALKSEMNNPFPDAATNGAPRPPAGALRLQRQKSVPPPLYLHAGGMGDPSVEVSQASPTIQHTPDHASLAYLSGDVSNERLSAADRASVLSGVSDASSGGDDADESDHSRNSQVILRRNLDNLEKV